MLRLIFKRLVDIVLIAIFGLQMLCCAASKGFGDAATVRICDLGATNDTLTATASIMPIEPYGQPSNVWTMTFNDEFNQRELDRTRWSDRIWYGNLNDLGGINYDINAGNNSRLRIWPLRNADGTWSDRHIHSSPAVLGSGKGFEQKYGYFEARIKAPYGRGVHAAFWLLNHKDGSSPFRPELDIVEWYGGAGPASGWGNSSFRPTQYGVTFHNDAGNDKSRISVGPFKPLTTETTDLSSDFHVYALEWRAGGELRWYFDGVLLGQSIYSAHDKFDTFPLYLVFSIQLNSGASGGLPNAIETVAGSRNALEVDWVRVYRRD